MPTDATLEQLIALFHDKLHQLAQQTDPSYGHPSDWDLTGDDQLIWNAGYLAAAKDLLRADDPAAELADFIDSYLP